MSDNCGTDCYVRTRIMAYSALNYNFGLYPAYFSYAIHRITFISKYINGYKCFSESLEVMIYLYVANAINKQKLDYLNIIKSGTS